MYNDCKKKKNALRFRFARIRLQPLNNQILHQNNCFSKFTALIENFLIRWCLINKICSTRDTYLPVRLSEKSCEKLFLSKHTSQFKSLWEMRGNSGWRGSSELLADAPIGTQTSSSTKSSENFSNHTDNSRNGFLPWPMAIPRHRCRFDVTKKNSSIRMLKWLRKHWIDHDVGWTNGENGWLNKRRSSRMRMPLVKMLPNWFRVSTYLIRVSTSRMIWKFGTSDSLSDMCLWLSSWCPASLCSRLVRLLLRSSIKTFFSHCVCSETNSLCFGYGVVRSVNFNDQIPKIKSGETVHMQTCIWKNDLKFRLNVKKIHFCQEHPHGKPPNVDFESWRSQKKSGVFEHSQSAMSSNISHDNAAWPAITCKVNKKSRTRYTSVTNSGPFRDCSCHSVSQTTRCRVCRCRLKKKGCQNDSTNFWQFSHRISAKYGMLWFAKSHWMHPKKHLIKKNDVNFSRSTCFRNLCHLNSKVCFFTNHFSVVH